MDVKYKKLETISEFIDAIRLRANVFIKEQGFQPGWEPDEDDKNCMHFIAIYDGRIVSTARIKKMKNNELKIERMATMKEYRERGIGKGLLEFMIKEISKQKPRKIFAASQVRSQPFYEHCGFKAISKPFDMYGVPHINMEYQTKK